MIRGTAEPIDAVSVPLRLTGLIATPRLDYVEGVPGTDLKTIKRQTKPKQSSRVRLEFFDFSRHLGAMFSGGWNRAVWSHKELWCRSPHWITERPNLHLPSGWGTTQQAFAAFWKHPVICTLHDHPIQTFRSLEVRTCFMTFLFVLRLFMGWHSIGRLLE